MTLALDALVFVKVCKPVVGVRQGATGPGRRLRATPVTASFMDQHIHDLNINNVC